MKYIIVAGVALLVISYACFLIFQALHKGVSSASKALADQKNALANKRAERLAEEQLERGRAYRARNPVRAVGIPNPDAYRRAFTFLDEYASAANAYPRCNDAGSVRSCPITANGFLNVRLCLLSPT